MRKNVMLSEFDINQFRKKRVLVFGDFMVDEYLDGEVSRVSPEAPVPVVHLKNRLRRLGGAGNVVRNLRAMEAEVCAVGCIGNDENGRWISQKLQEEHVDIVGLMLSDLTITSIKTRITARHQQLLRYDQEKVCDVDDLFYDFIGEKVEKIFIDVCAVVISDYGKGGVTSRGSQLIIGIAKKQGIPVIVDPKGTDYSKYRGATICTPNMKELSLAVGHEVVGEESIRQAGIEICRENDIEYVLATRSENGMSLICGNTGEKKDYPAKAKEVIDVTGAGDTVVATIALCWAMGASHDDSCHIANIAASIVVSKFGAATAALEEIAQAMGSTLATDSKIVDKNKIVEVAEYLRAQGKRIVFTNGCFDIVHAGHISSFKQAKEFGDVLVLGLNSDASIRRIKGEKRPIVGQDNRAKLLAAINYIDYIVLFEEDTPEELIRLIRPDVLVKGQDWEGKEVAGGQFVKQHGGEVRFIELEKGLSTTSIIEKILEVYGSIQ